MTFLDRCPQCGNMLENRHIVDAITVVCDCGWHSTEADERAQKKNDRIISRKLWIFGFVVALIGFHLLNWGSYALFYPRAKVAQIFNALSSDDYKKLATACIELGKYELAKDAYRDLFNAHHDVEALAQLGTLHVRLTEATEALNAYGNYVKFGGNDGMIILKYAQLAEAAGQFDIALPMYQKSIELRPENLPIQATTSIVNIYMRLGKYEEAYQKLNEFYASAGNARSYLQTEHAQLEKILSDSRRRTRTRPARTEINFGGA